MLSLATFQSKLLVRRVPDLSESRGKDVAFEALTLLHRGYSLVAVPALAWQASIGALWRPHKVRDTRTATICSTVVNSAYSASIATDLVPGVEGTIWPADLSETRELRDVTVGWMKLSA